MDLPGEYTTKHLTDRVFYVHPGSIPKTSMFGAESGVMMAFMGIFYAGAGAGQAAIMVGDASKAKVEMFLLICFCGGGPGAGVAFCLSLVAF